MKDFSRLMSAHSQYQAKVYSQFYIKSPHAVMKLSNNNSLMHGPINQSLKPSGIKAIDDYYQDVEDLPTINNFTNATEMNRVIDQTSHLWKAYKFPKCEQKLFQEKLEAYITDPNFHFIQDEVSDQLEDYLKYVKEFIDL
jgi:hypothetical protein